MPKTHALAADLRNKMKEPRGLVILGDALGNQPTDSFPMGDDAFVSDHLQGVADITLAAWALIAKISQVLPEHLMCILLMQK